MATEMVPEAVEPEETQEPLKTVETEETLESDKRVSDLMERVRKLDRQNTDLRKDLERKDNAGKTFEERLATIEGEREKATERARTVEAFADAGLGESWRKVFEEKDPFKRADMVRELLKSHEQDVAKKLATELDTAGAPELKGGKPQYSMEDLKDMSEADINKAFAEGRVQGM